MIEALLEALRGLPPGLTTFLVAALPVSELRGAIPYALLIEDLPVLTAYLLAVAGNLLPVPFLLFGLEPAARWLRRWSMWDRFFEWLFEHTRRRGRVVEEYRALGLMLFVAIPLPVTGAWTGCAAAFLFGVPRRWAFPAVAAGVLIAGVVVTLASLGLIGGARLFAPGI